MPRSKKQTDNYEPSEYQRAIFDFVEHGHGNAVVEAEAGSGKSWTLVKCLSLVPKDAKILVTAFNTSIVEELEKKIKNLPNKKNIDCRTMHSLGYSILLSNFKNEISKEPNDFKYQSYVYNNIKELSDGAYSSLSVKDKQKYIDNIKKFVDFGRYYLCQTVRDLEFIESRYKIHTLSNEKEVAIKAMEWGKENYNTIDFTDMVWLPNVLDCKPYGKVYDWIFVDEAQDVEKEERELLLRCTKMSTRIIAVGQKIQCINSWKGADYQSFDEFKKLPNTRCLPLSISYRCPKSVVKLANRFSPTMEAKKDAIEGEVKRNCSIDEIQNGDMVLCRVNAPLLQMYCELANAGKIGHICGRDMGNGLINMISNSGEDKLSRDLKSKGVFPKLYDSLFTCIDSVMRSNAISFEMAMEDFGVSEMYDNILALETISDGLSTSNELIDKINSLFDEDSASGVTLTTIHKAKGLEADNVYICCPSLLPAKSAKEQWELQQEANLEYVAYTRSKKKLGFLNEDNFNRYSANAQQVSAFLKQKKDLIFSYYGGKERCIPVIVNENTAKDIINSSSDIKETPKNAISLDSISKTNNSFSFGMPHKKAKKRITL